MQNQIKTIAELKKDAVNWWPQELLVSAASESPSILLENSIDEFCNELSSLPADPQSLRSALENCKMPFNLFIKHLVVLADFGGEPIKRVHSNRMELFSSTTSGGNLDISYSGSNSRLPIDSFMSTTRVDNVKLGIDGPGLVNQTSPNPLGIDMATILLCGAFAINPETAEQLSRCDLQCFAGDHAALEHYLRTRYLGVSRIIQGATANALGQALQSEVRRRLMEILGDEFEVTSNSNQTVDGRRITSDVFVTYQGTSVAIEIAFQQTTNSTIERKATVASQRRRDLNSLGIPSCYVLDGVGVFDREAALTKLLAESDFVVNFSTQGTSSLAEYIREYCKK